MDMEIAYTRAGFGVPLVLLHAFPLSSVMWDAQRGGLSRECEVITVDQRGFGESAAPDAFDGLAPDLTVAADDLAALLDQWGVGEFVLGGLSMGGYVAMNFLRRHADRVRGLLLANTKASADPPEAAENRRRIADAVEQAGTSDLLLTEVAPKLLSDTADPDVVRHVDDLVRAAAPNAVAWAQRAMSVRRASFDVLTALSVPVLVIAGDADVLTPVTEAEAMATAAADCELVVLPEVGHLSNMQAPREFNAAVSGLLKRV